MSTKKPVKTESPDDSRIVTTQMGGLFLESGGTAYNKEEWEDKSLPPLIKAKDFPKGACLRGIFQSLTSTDIPNTKKKGALVVIDSLKGRCSVPATAVITRALEISGIDDGHPTSALLGREIMIVATGAQETRKKGMRDFWGFDVKIKKS